MNTKPLTNPLEEPDYVIHPKKAVLWLLIVASVMLFAGFTSAYIVRRGEGNWELFQLPSSFLYSTIIIALSSITMQLGYFAQKKGNTSKSNGLLLMTLLAGIAFCVTQYIGWTQLVKDNVYFAFSNPSNSFVYVITGVHIAHMLGGIIFLAICTFLVKLKATKGSTTLYLSMCNTYWHFIGILWIYLYIFLTLYR